MGKVASLPDMSVSSSRMTKKKIDISMLINRLNCLNFREEPVFFRLQHKRFDNVITRPAIPQPCLDEELECRWLEAEDSDDTRLRSYNIKAMVINDGQRLTEIEPDLVNIDGRQVTVRLPNECQETQARSIKRYSPGEIKASLAANSAVYEGTLVDFNAFYFRVRLKATPPQTFEWISSQVPVNITLANESGAIYIGDCNVVRHNGGEESREYVLHPTRSQYARFKSREFRSERHALIPQLNVVFSHPITKKTMNLKMVDLSGTGFSLEESFEEASLLPGMVLSNVGIQLTNRSKLTCKAQVIHRTRDENSEMVQVGLALLDIDALQHMELVSLLQQIKSPDIYVSAQVDPEEIWNLFFETGFIYPKKYVAMAKNKATIQESFTRLYTDHPEIARHMVHMEHGKMLGHFSMIRLYEKTWLNHHHAALPHKRKSGLLVLDKLCEYINDTHTMFNSKIRYSVGYYQTTNKFPVRFYGKFCDTINNKKACHVDDFGYVVHRTSPIDEKWDTDNRWELAKVRSGDLEDLKGFYEQSSGGLLLDALDMTPEDLGRNTLDEEYAKAGIKRAVHRMAVKRNGELKAIILVNQTDIGLNLTELTNATKVIVVDDTGFKKEDLSLILSLVGVKFGLERIPTLIYPVSYLDKTDAPYEKVYSCNIMSLQYWDEFMRYVKDFMKRAKVH